MSQFAKLSPRKSFPPYGTVNLAQLQSSTRELQWLQFFKMVFLKIPNVLLRTVVAETVTIIAITTIIHSHFLANFLMSMYTYSFSSL